MTVEQLSLDAQPTVKMPARPETLDQRYARWLRENPGMLDEIARTTRELRAVTGRAPTIAKVWEELRDRVWTTGEPFRWDNSLRALAARDVMDRYPDLAGVFRLRRRTS